MINKRKITLIVSLLLVMLGVLGSLTLVKRSQDLRRSAVLEKTIISLSPSTISGAVGSTVSVGIIINVPTTRKVSIAAVKLCYGDALIPNVGNIVNPGLFSQEISTVITGDCLIITRSVDLSLSVDQLPTGSFQFANVSFTIKNNGILTISKESSISGQPVNGDVKIPIDEFGEANVTMSGSGHPIESGSSMTFESDDLTSKKINDTLIVRLYLDTSKKIDSAEVKFCYGNKLRLEDSGIVKGADFTGIAKKEIDNNNCLSYTVYAMSKTFAGKILLGTFNFKAVNKGDGIIEFDKTIKYFSGPEGQMTVEKTPSVGYTIVAGCTPNGTTQCVNGIQQTCTNGNWGNDVKCDSICDVLGKKCYVCTAGQDPDKICENNIWKKCKSDESGWETITDCGALGKTCDETQGGCVGGVCAKNTETRCSSNKLETCNSTGTGWGTGVPCDTGYECLANGKVCTAIPCTASNWSFVLSPTTCPNNGQQTKTWTKTGTCTGGVTHPDTETVHCFVGTSSATVNVKLAFAGVKNNNGKCAKDNWLVKIKLVNSIHTVSCSFLECGNCDADICSSMMGCTLSGNLCVSDCAGVTGTKCVGSILYHCNNGRADSFPDLCGINGCDATNGKCNGVGETIPTFIGKVLSGYPTQTTSANSRGEIVYDFSVTAAGVSDNDENRLAFFLTGPKHISVKYGENSQTKWYPNLVGTLNLAKGTNSYDFSEYPLLAGDVTGETVGIPDGKIDGRDYSYIKNKAIVLVAAVADGTNLDGDVNGDCQVNSGDVSLMVDSLKEINGQTY